MLVRYVMLGESIQATAVHGYSIVFKPDGVETRIVDPSRINGEWHTAEIPREQFDSLYEKVCCYTEIFEEPSRLVVTPEMRKLSEDVKQESRAVLMILRTHAEREVKKASG